MCAGLVGVIATLVWLETRTCKEVIADTIVCTENVDYHRLKLRLPGVKPVDVVRPG